MKDELKCKHCGSEDIVELEVTTLSGTTRIGTKVKDIWKNEFEVAFVCRKCGKVSLLKVPRKWRL